MTPRRLAGMSLALGAAVVVASVARGESTMLIPGLVALAVTALALVAGVPALVTAGTGLLIVTWALAVWIGDDSGPVVESAAVAVCVWGAFEAAMRSFELRRAVRPDVAASSDWWATALVLVAATVGAWVAVVVLVGRTDDGGLVFRVVALGVVVLGAMAIVVVDRRRVRSAGAAVRDAGSGGRPVRDGSARPG
ncbi:MAG: hypothetical protein ACXIVQ_15930 [Acidimicrobiales bacterium]